MCWGIVNFSPVPLIRLLFKINQMAEEKVG